MLFTVKQDLEICEQLKINVRQLMFLKMLVPDTALSTSEWKVVQRNITSRLQAINGTSPSDVKDLVDRKIVIDCDPDNDFLLYCNFEIKPRLMTHFRTDILDLAEELVDAYPYELSNDTTTFTAKNATPEEISEKYIRAINNDPDEHLRVIQDLKWAIDNNALKVGLRKFVDTKFWNHIRTIKTTKPQGGFDVELG